MPGFFLHPGNLKCLFPAVGLALAVLVSFPSGSAAQARYQGRDNWQMPDSVVAVLGIEAGEVVADIGAGSGYFASYLCAAVGPQGRYLAVDIDTAALGRLAERAAALGLTNLDTVHAAVDDPLLPDGSVGLVFFCNTLHHISGRADYLKRLKAVLKPGGRVAVVDFFRKDLPVGPRDPGHKLSRQEALEALRKAGYVITAEYDFLPYQYFLVAGPATR
ncbi:MAG: class I SAM-dependent methyltransferase [Candidatus Glassbacteria bacterium]|nr:class I SAM-dependent methyltransferase [Candidatus Glassbacteria bacterium]